METLLKDLDVAEMEGFGVKKAVMQRNHTTAADIGLQTIKYQPHYAVDMPPCHV